MRGCGPVAAVDVLESQAKMRMRDEKSSVVRGSRVSKGRLLAARAPKTTLLLARLRWRVLRPREQGVVNRNVLTGRRRIPRAIYTTLRLLL